MKRSPKRVMWLNLSSTMSQPILNHAGRHGLNHDTQPQGSTSEKAVIFSGQLVDSLFFTAQPSTQPVEDAVVTGRE